MPRALKFAVVLLLMLTMLSGCKKKKPPLPPPQAQAPDITSIPQVEQPDPLPPPSPEPKTGPVKVLKPKPKPAPKKRVAKKITPKPEKKIIAKNGLEPGGLSAGVPASESNSQRRSTAQLLDAAESNLRSLKRTLRDDEQKMVQQIRSFMAQSRAAENDGDTERAYNLALKAHLLSIELVKR